MLSAAAAAAAAPAVRMMGRARGTTTVLTRGMGGLAVRPQRRQQQQQQQQQKIKLSSMGSTASFSVAAARRAGKESSLGKGCFSFLPAGYDMICYVGYACALFKSLEL